MKRILILVSFAFAAGALAAAYYCKDTFWQAVAINVSTTFLGIGFGVIAVNIYLERNSRKGAVRSLLVLSHESIAEFHNLLLDICWAKYGRDGWKKILAEYAEAKGKPEALRQEVREALYEIMKNNHTVKNRIDILEETLTELSRLVGWDLDASLLKACLDSRIAISRLKSVVMDDSPKAIDATTEHLLDSDHHSQRARRILMEMAGIKE